MGGYPDIHEGFSPLDNTTYPDICLGVENHMLDNSVAVNHVGP